MKKNRKLEAAIESYGLAAKNASQKNGTVKMLGFGAAAGGLFVAGQADADIVYSGVINAGFNVSTVNLSSTNAISPPLVFNSTGGAPAFALGGNNRGPANAVGSTDIVWAVGASYIGGYGGVLATAPSFPAAAIPLASSNTVGPAGTFASLAWVAAGLPSFMAIDPFGVGSTGSVTAFVGFSFKTGTAGSQTNYGWARIALSSAGGLPTATAVVDWAYDNMGNAIHVGSTVPAPGALALMGLAAGAAGIRRRRAA
jgi:hypothetical protein